MSKLTDLRGQLDERRKNLAKVFEQAGSDMDMSKVTLLEGDSAGKVDQIRSMNDEIADLHDQVKKEEELVAIRDGLDDLSTIDRPAIHPVDDGAPAARGLESRGKTIGDLFVASQAFKGFQAASMGAGPVAHLDVDLRAVLFQTSAGWAPESLRTGRVEYMPLRPAPQVIPFFPEYATNMAVVKYMEETTHTDNSAEVSESSTYGESAFALTERSQTVRKIGVWLPVTDEQLADEAEARSYVDNRLTYQLARRLDGQSLVGDGNAPNLLGTENVSGIQTQALGTDPIFDAAFKLHRKIRDNGFAEPSVNFIAPSKWETVRLTRTADGLYILGSPADPGPDRLWGVPIVQTTAHTSTKLISGDYATYSGLYVRTGIDVQVGYQNDDFIKGRLAIRADVRVAVVHFRPKAFGVVTGL
jgi:hypothetical protein